MWFYVYISVVYIMHSLCIYIYILLYLVCISRRLWQLFVLLVCLYLYSEIPGCYELLYNDILVIMIKFSILAIILYYHYIIIASTISFIIILYITLYYIIYIEHTICIYCNDS